MTKSSVLKAVTIIYCLNFIAAFFISEKAYARPCEPCSELQCKDDAEAKSALKAKRENLLVNAPARLVDQLLPKVSQCELCIMTAPDSLNIMIETRDSGMVNYSYSKYDEVQCRRKLKEGTIKAFHIFWFSSQCSCCEDSDRERPDHDGKLGLNRKDIISFTKPSDLGPEPKDLSGPDAKVPPSLKRPPNPPRFKTIHSACSACIAAADKRNALAEDLWEQQRKYNRLVSERDWVRRKVQEEWEWAVKKYTQHDMPEDVKKRLRDNEEQLKDPRQVVEKAKEELERLKNALMRADDEFKKCHIEKCKVPDSKSDGKKTSPAAAPAAQKPAQAAPQKAAPSSRKSGLVGGVESVGDQIRGK